MSKKTFVYLVVYLSNIALVVFLIGFVLENTFVKILLAIYLLVFSSVFTYVTRKKGRD
ncbi:MAG: hypothetical protein PHF05_08170 [Candidatus Izemoplasmatales bacterium]|nr:hypothetical protein [Candidatus Izemoplasmatales bacterium]MDD4070405.1 hypothetical protein [Candidatus Izemoplasmatales bacterium]